MRKTTINLVVSVFLFLFISCNKENGILSPEPGQQAAIAKSQRESLLAAPTIENFETGSKTSYAAGNVSLATGSWNFNDALLGNSTADKKNGTQSARIRNSGILTTNFDFTTGASAVSIVHSNYGSDAGGTWQLWCSVNNGSTYTQVGSTVTSTAALQTANFSLNISGNVRFQVRKTDGGTNRVNIDDFSVTAFSGSGSNPTLSVISPATVVAGNPTFILTATGTNFTSTSIVNWNGSPLASTFVSSTSITASVPAANVAAAGTANITVANGANISSAVVFTITAQSSGVKRFLFDATKAETSNNADWVIDEDNNSPQKVPTPAQANITSSTSETYWKGALSSWAIALVKSGDYVETLPSGTAITYGSGTNAQDLSHYDVFVIDEPNIRFTAAEKTAILNFVKNGGGLFMISDHTISDRNGDGWDSPEIWNDLMTNNTVQNNPFGFSIDLTDISEKSTNVLTNSSGNPILHGIKGNVTKLEFNDGASLTLQPSVNSSVQGLIWQNTYSQGNTHVMAASSVFGTGRVFVVTDSSPMDDGTGNSNDILFVSWPLYSHTQLFMNASLWLAKLQ